MRNAISTLLRAAASVVTLVLAGCGGGGGDGAPPAIVSACPSGTSFDQLVVCTLDARLSADTRQNRNLAPVRNETLFTERSSMDAIVGDLAGFGVTQLATQIPPANQCASTFNTLSNIAYTMQIDRIKVYYHTNLGISQTDAQYMARVSAAAWAILQANLDYPVETAAAAMPTLYVCWDSTGGNNSSPGQSSVDVSTAWNTSAGRAGDASFFFKILTHEGTHLTVAYVNGNPPSAAFAYVRRIPAWLDEGMAMYMGNQQRLGTRKEWDEWFALEQSKSRPEPALVSNAASGTYSGFRYFEAFREMVMHLFDRAPGTNLNAAVRYLSIARTQKQRLANVGTTPCGNPAPYTSQENCFREAFDAEMLTGPDASYSTPLTLDSFIAHYKTAIPADLDTAGFVNVKANNAGAPVTLQGGGVLPQADTFAAAGLVPSLYSPQDNSEAPNIAALNDGSVNLRTAQLPSGTYTIYVATSSQTCIKNFVFNAPQTGTIDYDIATATCR